MTRLWWRDVVAFGNKSGSNCVQIGGDKKISSVIRKEDAHRLVDQQPANATWEDLMHEIYVREIIKNGLEDCNAGRTKDMKETRGRYRPLNDPLTSGFMNIIGETK